MTLITMIAAPWGVWHCSDKRLTNFATGEIYDDDSQKNVTLTCSDGRGIITYTGIGTTRDGRHVSEWVRDQLIGEARTVEQSLAHLCERATQELAPRLSRLGIGHVFMLSALLGSAVSIGEIANIERWDGPVLPEFTIRTSVVQDEGFVGIGGVRDAVSSSDLERLRRLKDVRPNQPADYEGLLAEVNRGAASRSSLISEACETAFTSPDQDGVSGREFFGHDREDGVLPMSHVLHGIDVSPMMAVLQEQAARSRRDPTFDINSDEAKAEREAAARRGTGENR